ncbi:MAG: MBL fold metallo-hydrolase [Clostridia bacterium]|nr:MBL fold metallo-hydrolase [Clostridia bacterium]
MNNSADRLLYQGHGSLRITTAGGKVIYIDPYEGDGYDKAADLILVTHSHSDHTAVNLIGKRNPDCRVITYKEALEGGTHHRFDFDYVTVEAVEAGYNRNHNVKECVGYILTLQDGITLYVSGDTSRTPQMARLARRNIDYALFCCDGVYNMDTDEAVRCAALVGAKHNIPYHMAPGKLFDKDRAGKFDAPNRLIIADGEEIELNK